MKSALYELEKVLKRAKRMVSGLRHPDNENRLKI
jgi:hypothetical protein